MKLALSINGTPIPVPEVIENTIPNAQPIIQTIIGFLLVFGIILALFSLIRAGFTWMTSGGEKEKVTASKNIITYVLVGLIVLFLSFFVINLLQEFLTPPQQQEETDIKKNKFYR